MVVHRSALDPAIADSFEERADHIDEKSLLEDTATGDFFDSIHRALVSKNLVLIVGPRGCGKTHIMRYTHLLCRQGKRLPLSIYVTFNRYYRLEPLLKTRADAVDLFHLWVLARIVEAIGETVAGHESSAVAQMISAPALQNAVNEIVGFDITLIKQIIAKLERSSPLSDEELSSTATLTVDAIADLIASLCDRYSRSHASVLLDDAALVLTPEYLEEFFDIVRVLKRTRIAPKASVYPGTTEYGPRFHAQHEGQRIDVWLPIDDPNYRAVMNAIAARRYPASHGIPPEINDLLKYAAFGIPRAYLTMLREYQTKSFSTQQQAVNYIVEQHRDARLDDYRSLALKLPRLDTVVRTGEKLFSALVEAIRQTNLDVHDNKERQTTIGIPEADLSPLVRRMINLLVEAGLLFAHDTSVSHGTDRTYQRYTPHTAALMAVRAFSGRSRGFSPRQILDYINRKPAKHPVRRSMSTLLSSEALGSLRLDLPPCQRCGTVRISEAQRFCHHCGAELIDTSNFAQCMALKLSAVPSLTAWQIKQLQTAGIKTISDLLAIQDPGTELRRIKWVGSVRSQKILGHVAQFVDEFLS